jgi:ABC-type dipeptide/oligopeptide/nickel transport system permease component/ABC-type transport system substrate-binding protein
MLFSFLRKSVLGAVVICLILAACGLLFSAKFEAKPLIPDEKELAVLAQLKDQDVDPANAIRLQVEVDYAEGAKARWYPKEESPLLKAMVDQGQLPPVQDRVGVEPLVLRGTDGEGNYGGTFYRIKDFAGRRFAPLGLVRWSPQGYPLVPNVAKSYAVNTDQTVFTFKLRKGMKWSDGHPFTSADILYWWQSEQCELELSPNGPGPFFVHQGNPAKVEAPDDETVVFSFSAPYSLFLERLAAFSYPDMCDAPKHFMEKFHPLRGDKKLIREVMAAHNLINEKAVYGFMRLRVERPSLAPWICKTESVTPPMTYVRNPYYWAVDVGGRQLPYLDRVVVNHKSTDMITISVAQGETSMQDSFLRVQDYTMLMSQRRKKGYELYHWQAGDGGGWGVAVNLNRRVMEGEKDFEQSRDKAKLLGDKRFRQALSLAIDRQAIVDALYAGAVKPSQINPIPQTPYRYDDFVDTYASFDPKWAERLLDECGLTARDAEGYRKFPGGPSLLFDLNYCSFMTDAPIEFILNSWRKVGVNVRLRSQERSVFYVEKAAGLHDLTVWGAYGAFLPILDPRYYFPFSSESNFATKNALWYVGGGLFAKDPASVPGVKPPEGSPLLEAMVMYERIKTSLSLEDRKKSFRRILDLAAENVYVIALHTPLPALAAVKDGFRNVPRKAVSSWDFLSPSNMDPETWFWEKPAMPEGETADIMMELGRIKPLKPLFGGDGEASPSVKQGGSGISSRAVIASVIKWGILLGMVLLLALLVMRSPYFGHRLLLMVPTLFIISVISFVVIEIPPGDAINSKIIQMQEQGGLVDQKQVDDLKAMFRTDEPAWKRYAWWMGFDWFVSLDRKDQGLLQGNMGRSMIDLNPVNQKVGDRLLFTFLLSLGTILFTWLVALPIGIYSAVRQYSFFDYVFTIAGFIGMCIPGFLLALLLMFGAERMFGLNMSGLFSPEYAAQSGWSLGKVLDLMRHLWLPVLVQGVTGTAGMIRVMRANLLDELKKPYVTTARAKGVRPLKLLMKYPVRVALNPFVSGIGGIFPELISGGAIISIVMSLPTIGPMQLDAVMQQDMYLAGSMLMVLSTLSVLGTLVSDLLLVLVDPRIRMGGGGK